MDTASERTSGPSPGKRSCWRELLGLLPWMSAHFVLGVAMAAAARTLDEQSRLTVSLDELEELGKAMDEASPAPRLKEALGQPRAWDA